MNAYKTLELRFADVVTLNAVLGLLDWDREAVMPKGAGANRGRQMALIGKMRHERLTDPDMQSLFDAAADLDLEPVQARNLALMRLKWIYATTVDSDLVGQIMEANIACNQRWQEARKTNDFDAVRPLLERVLELQRQRARQLGDRLGCEPYDALVGEYQPGISTADIDPIFDRLAEELPPLIAQIEAQQRPLVPLTADGMSYDVELQRRLGEQLRLQVGLDPMRTRLDVSTHPFCSEGGPFEVRITTRYNPEQPLGSIMGVLHEAGHAMYELGRPIKWALQPVGDAMGMAIHESQSLVTEMVAGRSDEFACYLAAQLREHFGDIPQLTDENVRRNLQHVERGLIRVQADTVTYPLHVIMRYRLERAMIEGRLEVADLPEAWNTGMYDLLGITPTDFANGVMQDTHWFQGAFGYFPSYTLGAIAAVQLWETAISERPQIPQDLARGDYSWFMDWLGAHIHSKGSLLGPNELLTEVTGRTFDVDTFVGYLRSRYLG